MPSYRSRSPKEERSEPRSAKRNRPDPFLELLEQPGDKDAWWPAGATPLQWMLAVVVGEAQGLDHNHRFFRSDLEDIAILTLSQFWAKRHEVEFPRAWCRTVARRHLLDELEQMPVRLEELVETGVLVEGPWGTVDTPDSGAFIQWFRAEVLPQLDRALRPVAELVFVEDLDYTTVAQRLGMKSGTLRVYVGRARDQIDSIALNAVIAAVEDLDSGIREAVRAYLLPPFDPPWEIENHTGVAEAEVWRAVRRGVRQLRRKTDRILRLWPRLREPLEDFDHDY